MKDIRPCSSCGATSAIFVTLVKAGQVIQLAYCKKDAEKLGILAPNAYGFLKEFEPPNEAVPAGVLRCPHCRFTQFDFNHQGRLGCSQCYDVFTAQLIPILKQLHKGVTHVGKVPYSKANPLFLHNRLQQLQKNLRSVISQQHFEDAAQIREEIDLVTKQLAQKNR